MTMIRKSIRELQKEAYQTSKNNGWHKQKVSIPEICALIHTEVSELMEQYREGRKPNEMYWSKKIKNSDGSVTILTSEHYIKGWKEEGIPSEFADIFIRVMDACEANDIDLESTTLNKMEYNKTREERHGNKVL